MFSKLSVYWRAVQQNLTAVLGLRAVLPILSTFFFQCGYSLVHGMCAAICVHSGVSWNSAQWKSVFTRTGVLLSCCPAVLLSCSPAVNMHYPIWVRSARNTVEVSWGSWKLLWGCRAFCWPQSRYCKTYDISDVKKALLREAVHTSRCLLCGVLFTVVSC